MCYNPNMDKLLLLTDTHLGLHDNSDVWLNVTLNLFKEIRDVCLTKNISNILHLGDFFHEKKHINQKTLDYAYDISEMIDPFRMTIITGNHDIYYKDVIKPSSLRCFQNNQNIDIVKSTVEIYDDLTLIPWNGEIPPKGFFCFGHFSILSFNMNNSSVCNNGISPDIFKNYKQVYSGHFHTPSHKDNITYLGTPFQQTFHDVGSSRGYYIFDNGDLEFIEYKSAPKFIKLHTEDELKNIEGNVVKLIYDKDYGTNTNSKILEEVEKQKPLRIDPDFNNISNENDDGVDEQDQFTLIKHDDIIREWVKTDKKIPNNINKKVLLKIMDKMMEDID